MFQVHPLFFLRMIADEYELKSSPSPVYGSGQYLTADRFFIISRRNTGEWRIGSTGNLRNHHSDIVKALADSGIFTAVFRRRRDCLEALEIFIQSMETQT